MKYATIPDADVVQAVIDSNGTPGKIPWAESVVAPRSSVKLLKGGTLSASYKSEHLKARYIER